MGMGQNLLLPFITHIQGNKHALTSYFGVPRVPGFLTHSQIPTHIKIFLLGENHPLIDKIEARLVGWLGEKQFGHSPRPSLHDAGVGKCPIEHHPTIGDINSNRYLKVIFKIPKKGHLPTPVMDA